MLGSDLVIGRGSCIGVGTHITQSVIGKGCKIGNYVDITNAYLLDNIIVKVSNNQLRFYCFSFLTHDYFTILGQLPHRPCLNCRWSNTGSGRPAWSRICFGTWSVHRR